MGQTVSHYRILSKIGGGGMGVVYEADRTIVVQRLGLLESRELLTNAICYVRDRSSEELRRGTPLNVLWVYSSNVPDYPVALTTYLRTRKLLP